MSIPYRFRTKGLFRYENSNRYQKEIQEQAKRDARDETRLYVEKGIFWVGVFGLIGLLYTLYLTRVATNATWIQVETARGQLELSERPWITAEVALTRPFSTSGKVGIEVSVKNVGRSVAIDVEVRAEVVFDPILSTIENGTITFPLPDPSEIDVRREILCGERFRQTGRAGMDRDNRLVLFPEQEGAIQSVIPIHAYEVTENTFQGRVDHEAVQEPFEIDMFVSPVLIGCITYSSAFTERRYATEFTRIVSSINHPDRYVPVGVSVPVENIRLEPYHSHGRIHAQKYID